MKKNFTPFERGLKDKMENFEFPYEQGAWALLQREMGMAKTGGSVWIFTLVSTILVLSGGAIALYRHQHSPSQANRATTTMHLPRTLATITKGVSHQQSGANALLMSPSLTSSSALQNTTLITASSSQSNGIQSTETSELSAISVTTTEGMLLSESTSAANSIQGGANTPAVKRSENVIAFNCNVRRACQGEEVEFQTTSGPKAGSYLWNFGDGHFSDEVNPKHKFAKAGNYDVSLSITSDNGQINTTVVNDMISIEAAPDADFTWEFINTNPSAPEVRIVNRSEGGNSYEWNNGSQSTVDPSGTVFKLNSGGRQMIALSAKNEAGCTDGAVKHISVNTDFALDAAQSWSFSKGTYMPAGLKKNKVDFTMTLIDASGKRVFETSSRMKGWDGKLPDGRIAGAGEVFSYMIIITNDLTQEQKYFNGILTVSP